MNHQETVQAIQQSRDKGTQPVHKANLKQAYLPEVDFYDTNLEKANLQSATLYEADMWDAYAPEANFSRAYLKHATLRDGCFNRANFQNSDLYGANLAGTQLCNANLTYANLHGANLTDIDLYNADLRNTHWDGLRIDGLDSGVLDFYPTPNGWQLSIGCWENKTIEDLEHLFECGDEDWPEASGEERVNRQKLLQATIPLLEAHMTQNNNVIKELEKKWK